MRFKAKKAEKPKRPFWQETIGLFVVALGLAILIKALFVQAFYIPSESMEPQFVKNDRILVQKVTYWGSSPARGDIVVFKDPNNWLPTMPAQTGITGMVKSALTKVGLYPAGGHLVKRVIGVGGDHIKCCDKRNRILLNGEPLREDEYLAKNVLPSTIDFEVKVPEGKLWVMGDNRLYSQDSRAHQGQPGGGFVPVDLVVGRVWVLMWPFGRAEFVSRPDSFTNLK